MARDWYINGPAMIRVKGRGALTRNGAPSLLDLGLAQGDIQIIPNIVHRDIYVDDFGSDMPAEVMYMGTDCQIHMTLSHYDEHLLHQCVQNSVGNYNAVYNPATGANPEALDDQGLDITDISRAGYIGGAGKMLGGGRQRFEDGNLYISLSITSEVYTNPTDPRQEPKPYRFPTAYIAANPMSIPIGTGRSLVTIRWRAIGYRPPYANFGPLSPDTNRTSDVLGTPQDLRSRGVPVWDRRPDTDN